MTGSRERSGLPGIPGGGAFRVGAGIFLSRVAGFAREAVFAYYFGATAVADVWRAALRTPNVLQNLLGEGTLSASFIPVYSAFLERGREQEAVRFAGAALGILAAVSFGLALAGIALAPYLISLFFPRWEPWMQDLAVRLVRVLFPMTAVLVVSAWALGVLNSHRRFFLSYVAPVAWNLAMIAVLVGGGTGLGLAAAGREADLAVLLAWGGLVGAVLQLSVQVPGLIPLLPDLPLSLGRRVEGVAEAIRAFWPVLLARGVVNLSGWLDLVVAHFLAVGAIAVLGYAQILYLLPISLFGMSIAAAELPELARGQQRDQGQLGERVAGALERNVLLLFGTATAFGALGDVFVAALFQRGEFGPASTVVTHAVLAGYALGLPASGSSRLLASAFYALRDTRVPARIAYLRVAVSLAASLLLMFPLDRIQVGELRLGAVGLALGASFGAWLEYFLLRQALERRIGPHAPPAGRISRIAVAAGLACLIGWGAKAYLGFSLRPGLLADLLLPYGQGWLLDPLAAAATATVFGVGYWGSLRVLVLREPPGKP